MLHKRLIWLFSATLTLAACGSTSDPDGAAAGDHQTGAGTATSSPGLPLDPALAASSTVEAPEMPPRLQSCSAEIGSIAAASKVAVCRNVSPATHPPCNAANSCAMIDTEIARSCALFDDTDAPMTGCEPSPKSSQAAVAVVRRYYAAINAHDYDTAWAQWGGNGQQGQTRARFEAGFAHTRETSITIGELQPGDAGAGSLFQPVPVTVEATLDDGTRQRFRGIYVVRRVNDVDGASAAQLRWHLGSAQLRPIPEK